MRRQLRESFSTRFQGRRSPEGESATEQPDKPSIESKQGETSPNSRLFPETNKTEELHPEQGEPAPRRRPGLTNRLDNDEV